MAVTYYVALPFIRTEDGAAPHRSAKAKPPRSGGPKECHAILPTRGQSHSSVQAIRTLASFRTRSCEEVW
jgi:hypothetical protein